MQADLQDFLTRIAMTIAVALVPVALVVFATLPTSLHHHIGARANVMDVPPLHMT